MKITGPYRWKYKGKVRLRKKPWRLYHNGQQTWHKTKELAEKAAGGTLGRKKKMTARNTDEYWHCRELLKGAPLLRAVRYYLEGHGGEMKNAGLLVSELATKFKAGLKGRKKYTDEATRCIDLLVDHCGKVRITAVSPTTIEEFLSGFESEWSHDQALKFARSFFKWCMSPQIHARRDNPTAVFEFKNPSGSRIHLSLEDALHVLKLTKKEFPDIQSAVAMQMFNGIRTAEIIRLDWKHVRRGKIRLNAEVAKMGQVKGKSVPRFIDWWPKALDVWMPKKYPKAGPIAVDYMRRKGELLARCIETKPEFVWGQNAFRHSYATYGLAFFQSGDLIAKQMGERDVDTVHNHYADYVEIEEGQKYFSLGCDSLMELPLPKNAFDLFQRMLNQQKSSAPPLPASVQPGHQAAS